MRSIAVASTHEPSELRGATLLAPHLSAIGVALQADGTLTVSIAGGA